MSAIIKVDSLEHYEYSAGKLQVVAKKINTRILILPLIKKITIEGKTRSWHYDNAYSEQVEGEKEYFVFCVNIDNTLLAFNSENKMNAFIELLKVELDDFYLNYSDYVKSYVFEKV